MNDKNKGIVRINNTINHQESEPSLIQVARCPTEPPDNEELIIDMDLPIPPYIKHQLDNDKYLDKEALDRFIESNENPYEDDYKFHEIG